MALSERNSWTRSRALAIPEAGYFQLEHGKYGPVFPRTPACHGFTIVARIKPGRGAPLALMSAARRSGTWRRPAAKQRRLSHALRLAHSPDEPARRGRGGCSSKSTG